MINAIISAITSILLSAVFLTGLYLTMTATAFASTGHSPYLYYNMGTYHELESVLKHPDITTVSHGVRIPEIYRPGKSPESG